MNIRTQKLLRSMQPSFRSWTVQRPATSRIMMVLWTVASTVILLTARAADSPDLQAVVEQAKSYAAGESLEPMRRLEAEVRRAIAEPARREAVEAVLVQLLDASASYEARKFACQQLAIIGTERSLPALERLLYDEQTVSLACLALGSFPLDQANVVLRRALPKLEGVARVQVIHTLGDRRDAEAVDLLTRLARGHDRAAAEAAILALGRINTASARQVLDGLRAQPPAGLLPAVHEALLESAAQQLANGERQSALPVLEHLVSKATKPTVRAGAYRLLLEADPDHAAERILEVLRARDAALMREALAGVGELTAADASERFASEFQALGPDDQVLLIRALARRGDQGARKAIAGQLDASDNRVRLAAIRALGQIGNAETVSSLVGYLRKPRPDAEVRAVESALAALPADQQTDRAMIEALRNAPPTIQVAVMNALGRRRVREAFPALLQAAQSAAPKVARAAFRALGAIAAAEDAQVLLDRLVDLQAADARDDAEYAVSQALLKIEDVAARSRLVRTTLKQVQDVDTRCALIRLLLHAADAEALAAVRAELKHSHPRVRSAALRALAAWPDPAAWEPLEQLYREAKDPGPHVLALRALVRLVRMQNAEPNDALFARYRTLLAHAQSDEDRKQVLAALAEVADPRALDLALPLVKQSGVRDEAALAVRKIAEAVRSKHPEVARRALEQLPAQR